MVDCLASSSRSPTPFEGSGDLQLDGVKGQPPPNPAWRDRERAAAE